MNSQQLPKMLDALPPALGGKAVKRPQPQRAFHEALGRPGSFMPLWAHVILDGVWLKVRRAFGPQRVLLLVAYGIRRNGTRELLAFTRAKSER